MKFTVFIRLSTQTRISAHFKKVLFLWEGNFNKHPASSKLPPPPITLPLAKKRAEVDEKRIGYYLLTAIYASR